MAGGAWSRRVSVRARALRGLARDTQKALKQLEDILHIDPDVPLKVHEIGRLASKPTALVILGTNSSARSRLLHCLLGRKILPDPMTRGCRWLRIQYGNSNQVHLTLGNSEFELVEELECNKKPWVTLPIEDLLRKEPTDMTTILEIELNNSFLKDGLKIIIPPDLDSDPGTNGYRTLKQIHSDLYRRREVILKNFSPVYLFAIDRMGKTVFSENVCGAVKFTNAEDFWSTYNFHYLTRSPGEVTVEEEADEVAWEASGGSAVFNGENCLDLHQLKEINPHSQLFFFLFSDSVEVSKTEEDRRSVNILNKETTESTDSMEELPESDQGLLRDGVRRPSPESTEQNMERDDRRLIEEQSAFMNDLLDQWELMTNPPPKHYVKSQWCIIDDDTALSKMKSPCPPPTANDKREIDDEVIRSRGAFCSKIVRFAAEVMQSYLLEYSTKLSEVHVKLLQQLILASFELARELQVVPRKIQYVAEQEQHLFQTINEKFSDGDKKQELLQIMQDVLQDMANEVNYMDWSVDDLPCHQDARFQNSNSVFYSALQTPEPICLTDPTDPTSPTHDPTAPSPTPLDVEEAVSYDTYNFDDYDIINDDRDSDLYRNGVSLENTSLSSQVNMIPVENEELASAASARSAATAGSTARCGAGVTLKQASLDVQHTVLSQLSRKISLKLVKFVDCLRDTYFGTLQRCLESLEASCRAELGGRPAGAAVRQLLSAARQVDLQPCASFSLLRALLDSFRRFFYKLRAGGGAADACCALSAAWRRRVAQHTARSLTPHRLARIISAQILERLSLAHERYQSALAALEAALANRLHHTEEVKLAIRKKYAPEFARLCLESTSMCDLLMYGTPELGREIGRGQYGVVYACRAWGGLAPAAVKSVLPADERHYRDLAMEFFYSRSVPEHPRVLRLRGSVVQRAGAAPCVLLVSARRTRDLHAALRAGLSLPVRMRISCDIVDGIRYLHSLGLVHRDIKMKNVLLDADDRAALSDLGFCTAEPLMSGSVVGTPVHMAPELLAGEYDAAVDVYAFGILFWYVCAGNIKLPSAFEAFQNKEQLWSKVKKGLRPERLPHFSDECWEVMQACWRSEPAARALLGELRPRLRCILAEARRQEPECAEPCGHSDDSLDLSVDGLSEL